MYKNVWVLTGQCSICETKYSADHEQAVENKEENRYSKVYLNSAKYLKVGQKLWVDRLFSDGVVNGMYNFHASVSAYAGDWNDSFWKHQSDGFNSISHRQIWQAFTQETIHTIAATSDYDLVLPDKLQIDEVTKEAFSVLGNDGLITAASQHSCTECTQEYKATPDTFPNEDPTVASGSRRNVAHQTDNAATNNDDMEVDKAMITMAVLDGIVIGPTVCYKFYCINNHLSNL